MLHRHPPRIVPSVFIFFSWIPKAQNDYLFHWFNNSIIISNMEAEQKKNSLFEFVKILVISLAIVFPIRAYVAQPFIVEGDSMEPNFSDGEYLIVDEISYRFKEPQRGDVIVFHPPTGQRIFFIKRIVGLPGEKVLIENGKIILGGGNERVILDEKYLPEGLKTNPDSSFRDR